MDELKPCPSRWEHAVNLLNIYRNAHYNDPMGESYELANAIDTILPFAVNSYRCATLEKKPLTVTLPCKVGTPLFGVTMDRKHIVPFITDEFIWSNGHWFVMGLHGEGDFDWADCYTTKSAAKQALAAHKPEGSET